MKKKIYSFLFFYLCNILITFSQSKLGINIGVVKSKFAVTNNGNISLNEFSKKFDHRKFKAELSYFYSLNKRIAVRTAVGINGRGTNVLGSSGIIGYTKFSLDYLNSVFIIEYFPYSFFSLNGGVDFGYLYKAVDYAGRRSWISTEEYEKIDFGIKPGVTFYVKSIIFDVKYYYSLKPVQTISLGSLIDPEDKKYYNRSLEFSIGYMFNLGKKNSDKKDEKK